MNDCKFFPNREHYVVVINVRKQKKESEWVTIHAGPCLLLHSEMSVTIPFSLVTRSNTVVNHMREAKDAYL